MFEWNFDPIALDLGFLEIRWYGICFMIGLLLGASELPRALQRRGLPKEHASSLTVWVPIGMIIGAHLIHLIFYEPRSFIDNPRRIIEIGLASRAMAADSVASSPPTSSLGSTKSTSTSTSTSC